MKMYTKKQLLKKYAGRYIDIAPCFYQEKDKGGNWITLYEVRSVKKTIHENYNLPEDCIID